jgi:cytochrome P450
MPRSALPPAERFDLASHAFKSNPIATLAAMRDRGSVIRVKLPLFGGVWMATTFDAVNELLRDHQRFVQNPVTAGNRGMGRVVRWLPGALKPLATNMLLRDPPDHRRLRKLVDQAFLRHSIAALQPRLEVLAEVALDEFAARAARSSDGAVDLLAHFARPFPLAVICELLGLPPEDRPRFSRWASCFATAGSVPGIAWGLFTGIRPMMRYVREEFRRQRRRPRGGLISALIEAEESGDKLSEDELVAMVFLLLTAGHETTLHQIALSVLTLLDHPNHLDALAAADWSGAETAVQELMRYASFAQTGKPRYARDDTEFHGQILRRGEMVFANLAAANFDPAEFAEPERLDLRRHPNRHVAFGVGIHYCLGAALARAEVEIALRKLFTRFPSIRLAVSREAVRFRPRFGTRGLMSLPVRW